MGAVAPHRVAVVGGGITGLVAATALAAEGFEVTVFEAAERVGGEIHTEEVAGIQVEAGADSFLVRDPVMLDLARSLGLEDELVAPAVFGASVWSRGRLHDLPSPAVMGVPASLGALWRTSLLSRRAKARAMLDLVLPRRNADDEPAVADAIGARLGREVVDLLIDPLLAGTRAGDPALLSLDASLPPVAALLRNHRSLLKAAAASRTGAPEFRTVREGLGRIPQALAAQLDAQVRTGTSVESIAGVHGGFTLRLATGEAHFDGVLLAVPAHVAAGLLAQIAPEASAACGTMRSASVASIHLVFDKEPPLPSGKSGILVPSKERKTLSAATWFTRKWPHVARDSRHVVRAFVGRAGTEEAVGRLDDSLVESVMADLEKITGAALTPKAWSVRRWQQGLPQYEVGHARRVALVDAATEKSPGLAVAGALRGGSGLPERVHDGRRAARTVASALRRAD